jgi:hypothetical protein
MSQSRAIKLVLTITLLLSFSGWALAQDAPPQTTPDTSSSKDAKKDKKKKKDKGSQDVMNTEVFSDDVARNVLNDIRDGLEGHSERLMLSAFDADKMDGYLTFEDQIQAMFQRYSEFRVHFRLSQATTEGPKGVILVDFEMEEVPNSTSGANVVPQRRNSQVRFELERGKKGWKVVDFSPRGFFS